MIIGIVGKNSDIVIKSIQYNTIKKENRIPFIDCLNSNFDIYQSDMISDISSYFEEMRFDYCIINIVSEMLAESEDDVLRNMDELLSSNWNINNNNITRRYLVELVKQKLLVISPYIWINSLFSNYYPIHTLSTAYFKGKIKIKNKNLYPDWIISDVTSDLEINEIKKGITNRGYDPSDLRFIIKTDDTEYENIKYSDWDLVISNLNVEDINDSVTGFLKSKKLNRYFYD
jgi:hypothetical protein